MRKFFLSLFLLLLIIGTCSAQLSHRKRGVKAEKELFGKSIGNKKKVKVKEPRKVLKAKKTQEAKERKLKSDYAKSIKKSQQRTLDIQTPEVQARMKNNQKESAIRDKVKKKKVRSSTKTAAKKYGMADLIKDKKL
jgi:hypothetical protein